MMGTCVNCDCKGDMDSQRNNKNHTHDTCIVYLQCASSSTILMALRILPSSLSPDIAFNAHGVLPHCPCLPCLPCRFCLKSKSPCNLRSSSSLLHYKALSLQGHMSWVQSCAQENIENTET